jgi:Cu(I)/Ag(I) efflux system periplasmic protein CusF
MRKTLLTIITLILSTPMATAQVSNMEGMNHGAMAMDKASAEGPMHVDATVNSIDKESVNVSHAPIPEIGWPQMTMDMPFAADIQPMPEISAGDKVIMTLVMGEDDMPRVTALTVKQ